MSTGEIKVWLAEQLKKAQFALTARDQGAKAEREKRIVIKCIRDVKMFEALIAIVEKL